MLTVAKFLHFLTITGFVSGAGYWDYGKNGEDWEGICKNGRKQSPINIITKSLIVRRDPKPVILNNYNRPTRIKAKFQDYSLKFFPSAEYKLFINGGGLPGKYILDHVQLRWPGGHTVDGKRPNLEAQFVHRSEKYTSIKEAAKHPEAIAILSTLYKEDIGHLRDHELNQIAIAAQNLTEVKLNFEHMIPKSKDFFRYLGSLASPGCQEVVIWLVLKQYLPLSAFHVGDFRFLINFLTNDTNTTYRLTQPLNFRSVELWLPPSYKSNSQYIHANSFILLAIIAIFNSMEFLLFAKEYD